jgi:retron-type reverse transcriptase
MITFDIKDLYVNIPIDETIAIVKTQLTKNKIEKYTITQAGTPLKTILRQNYVQSGNKFFQPHKGVAMGSPISGLIAEIFLQYYEQLLVKNILDDNKILFYNRYVDGILKN